MNNLSLLTPCCGSDKAHVKVQPAQSFDVKNHHTDRELRKIRLKFNFCIYQGDPLELCLRKSNSLLRPTSCLVFHVQVLHRRTYRTLHQIPRNPQGLSSHQALPPVEPSQSQLPSLPPPNVSHCKLATPSQTCHLPFNSVPRKARYVASSIASHPAPPIASQLASLDATYP